MLACLLAYLCNLHSHNRISTKKKKLSIMEEDEVLIMNMVKEVGDEERDAIYHVLFGDNNEEEIYHYAQIACQELIRKNSNYEIVTNSIDNDNTIAQMGTVGHKLIFFSTLNMEEEFKSRIINGELDKKYNRPPLKLENNTEFFSQLKVIYDSFTQWKISSTEFIDEVKVTYILLKFKNLLKDKKVFGDDEFVLDNMLYKNGADSFNDNDDECDNDSDSSNQYGDELTFGKKKRRKNNKKKKEASASTPNEIDPNTGKRKRGRKPGSKNKKKEESPTATATTTNTPKKRGPKKKSNNGGGDEIQIIRMSDFVNIDDME